MATKFITLTQFHRPKTLTSTPKSRRCNRNKPKQSKSINENIFSCISSEKTLREVYNNNLNSHPSTNPLLIIEDQSVKEVMGQQEQKKVSNCNVHKEGKSINAPKYGELRREVARLSLLWHFRSSISYILRKARAFYNEFCCDTYVETESNTTMEVVDPYFSIPVIPSSN